MSNLEHNLLRRITFFCMESMQSISKFLHWNSHVAYKISNSSVLFYKQISNLALPSSNNHRHHHRNSNNLHQCVYFDLSHSG